MIEKIILKQKNKMETKTQCVKVAELRKAGYLHIEDWMNNENNISSRMASICCEKQRKI